jgi:hypothetical protein
MRRYRLVYQDDERAGGDQADRREISTRIVAGIWIKRWIDRECAGAPQPEGIAIGRGLSDLTRAN